MTRTTLKAEDVPGLTGLALDATVAEAVLGHRWFRSRRTGRRCLFSPATPPPWFDAPASGDEPTVADLADVLPRYSHCARLAMAVFAHTQRRRGWAKLRLELDERGVVCVVTAGGLVRPAEVVAESIPEAVCRAAVLFALYAGESCGRLVA